MQQIAAGLISRNLFTRSLISNATIGQGTAWIIFFKKMLTLSNVILVAECLLVA